jgi:hypothetical protein
MTTGTIYQIYYVNPFKGKSSKGVNLKTIATEVEETLKRYLSQYRTVDMFNAVWEAERVLFTPAVRSFVAPKSPYRHHIFGVFSHTVGKVLMPVIERAEKGERVRLFASLVRNLAESAAFVGVYPTISYDKETPYKNNEGIPLSLAVLGGVVAQLGAEAKDSEIKKYAAFSSLTLFSQAFRSLASNYGERSLKNIPKRRELLQEFASWAKKVYPEPLLEYLKDMPPEGFAPFAVAYQGTGPVGSNWTIGSDAVARALRYLLGAATPAQDYEGVIKKRAKEAGNPFTTTYGWRGAGGYVGTPMMAGVHEYNIRDPHPQTISEIIAHYLVTGDPKFLEGFYADKRHPLDKRRKIGIIENVLGGVRL